jgi:hypothetical protein
MPENSLPQYNFGDSEKSTNRDNFGYLRYLGGLKTGTGGGKHEGTRGQKEGPRRRLISGNGPLSQGEKGETDAGGGA